MKLKSLLSLVAMVIAAKASAISYDASVNGTSAPAGTTFSAIGGDATLALKTQGGYTNLGVAGGKSGAEIGEKEKLGISFTEKQVFTNLTIGLLFDGPEYRDVYEIAAATTDASIKVFTLKAIGTTLALWDGSSDSVTNLSPAKDALGAVWSIVNPFGSLKVSQVWLYAVNSPEYNASTLPGKSASDFGLVSFTTVKAPDVASTIALSGLALLGMAVVARRK